MRRGIHRGAACAAAFGVAAAIAAGAQSQPQRSPQAQTPPPAGQQTPATQPAAPPQPAPPAKAIVPVAASTLAASPDAYYGEPVSMAGTIEQNLSKTAFSVDQDRTKSTGKDVLVLAPNLQRQVDANAYVTVIGEVVKFDPAVLGEKLKEYKLDLPSEVALKFVGKPAIIATSVIDPAGNDVAKRLPPPMTAEEEGYQKLMKQVGSANAALRKGIEASDVKLTAEHTAALKKTFAEVENFWRARRKGDAAQWSEDARKLSENIERSAAAGRWDDVKTHAATLGKACQTCHGAYRERFDDGSFRIRKEKAGA